MKPETGIAAVHGYCLGHVSYTALLCDLVVASRDARVQVTEISLGMPAISPIGRLGHASFADEVSLTGRIFTAEVASNAGMLTRLVDDGKHLRAPNISPR